MLVSNALPPSPATGVAESTIAVWDGAELFYRAWLPPTPPRQAILLFHRGHEHSGRLSHVAEALRRPETAVFAWDARGHGRSPGRRGFAPDFAAMVRDMDSFARGIAQCHHIALQHMVVVAHSVGAVVAAAWVHDYAPAIRGLVLVTPAFRVKLYVPLALPALTLLDKLKPDAVIHSYVKAKMLTHDPQMAADYQQDPLISRDISNRILVTMSQTARRVVDDAGVIRVPTLLLSAGSDWVVHLRDQRRFFADLGSASKQMITYPGFSHALLHEKDRHQPIAAICDFAAKVFAEPARACPDLTTTGDRSTRRRYEQLKHPLPIWTPRRWIYALTWLTLQTIGRMSQGIGIGWRHGFDSGQSLDHVYQNTARGLTSLGRLIDRIYLNGIGWRGIRMRKMHMQERLQWCINQLQAARMPLRIVDIAAGPGRYVLDTIVQARARGIAIEALLRDRDEHALQAGRQLAQQLGVPCARYEKGDAFDRGGLASMTPRPTIAIASGLYELFPDNAMIQASLAGLHDALEPGGYLLYTNQPWHPQLELIARVLPNRDGQPWIMRCRSQLEIDALVAVAGFQKLDMAIDPYGIFTVSVAQKA